MLMKYEVADLFPTVDGADGIYIYILYFSRDGRDIPFYVGQATDLHSRFSKHSQIDWHNFTFEEPTRIYIAGQVFKRYASSAEQELIALMINSNFTLTNEVITDHEARSANLRKAKLRELLKEEVHAYLDAPSTPCFKLDELRQWRQEWVFKPAAGELINTNLLREILRTSFLAALTQAEQETHERLTMVYSFKTARSTLSLTDAEVSAALQEIWDIDSDADERDRANNCVRLHPASIRSTLHAAEAVDQGVMNSNSGELSVNRCWAPHGRFKDHLEQQKQVRRLQTSLNKLREQGGSLEEIEALAAALGAHEESLEAHRRWLDEKYV